MRFLYTADTMDENETTDTIIDDVTFVESTEDGDELPAKDTVKKLRDELKQVRKEKEEYLTGWQRMKADYVNLQKEEDLKRKNLKEYVTSGLIEDILPVLDSFDMAFSNKEVWEKVDANWRNGVEYIRQQFDRVLEGYGVSKIDTIDVVFDPNIHESVEMLPTDDQAKDHTIAQIIQFGYKIGDKVIRPARVKTWQLDTQ